ncbi:MAG: DNA/RNA nuclease SfsA, partial [Candidatus Heimdallarchaeota archaeon]|nr:DNA/RNA nuclease SfsA [Candidatus Heimdallarchaeota archaeon]
MSFIISGKIKKGFFKERLNRFVCLVEIDEIVHNCHLPNPGRMIELLIPNITPVLVKLNDSPTRKTKATLIAVIKETEIINLDTSIVSNWFEYEIKNKTFSGLNHCNLIRKEIPILHHRIDFLLADGNEKEIFVEIKSTTLVRNGVACFPDGVSKRAVSQLKLLKELSDKGGNVLIIFIVQRKSNS